MRSLAFVLLIVSAAPAYSQVTAAKSQKRSAATLKDADDEDAPKQQPKKAEAAAEKDVLCGDPDRALGLALSYAFEQAPEEIRVLAVEDLGLLGDPRVLDAVATLVLDGNPRIQAAAVRAASQYTTVRATQILENVVRHPRLSVELKEQALRALPFQRRERARAFLVAVANASTYPTPLRKVAQEQVTQFDLSHPPTGALR